MSCCGSGRRFRPYDSQQKVYKQGFFQSDTDQVRNVTYNAHALINQNFQAGIIEQYYEYDNWLDIPSDLLHKTPWALSCLMGTSNEIIEPHKGLYQLPIDSTVSSGFA